MNASQVKEHSQLAERIQYVYRMLPVFEGRIATHGEVIAVLAAIVQACAAIVNTCAGIRLNDALISDDLPESEMEVTWLWRDVAERAMSYLEPQLNAWGFDGVLELPLKDLPVTGKTYKVNEIPFYAGLAAEVARLAKQREDATVPTDEDFVGGKADAIWPKHIPRTLFQDEWLMIRSRLLSKAEETRRLLAEYRIKPCSLPELLEPLELSQD